MPIYILWPGLRPILAHVFRPAHHPPFELYLSELQIPQNIRPKILKKILVVPDFHKKGAKGIHFREAWNALQASSKHKH